MYSSFTGKSSRSEKAALGSASKQCGRIWPKIAKIYRHKEALSATLFVFLTPTGMFWLQQGSISCSLQLSPSCPRGSLVVTDTAPQVPDQAGTVSGPTSALHTWARMVPAGSPKSREAAASEHSRGPCAPVLALGGRAGSSPTLGACSSLHTPARMLLALPTQPNSRAGAGTANPAWHDQPVPICRKSTTS